MEVLEYKKTFSYFDKDNDGIITASELSETLNSLGCVLDEKEVKTMLASVSSDGKTESVTFPEFIQAMEIFISNKKIDKELLDAFSVFDIDGDGFITFSELKQVMEKQFGATDATDANIKAMIEKADTDGDGRVNYSGMDSNITMNNAGPHTMIIQSLGHRFGKCPGAVFASHILFQKSIL